MKCKFLIVVILVFLLGCTNVKENEVPKEEIKLKEYYLSAANEVKFDEEQVYFQDDFKEIVLPRGLDNVTILYPSYTTLWYEAGGSAQAIIGGKTAGELYLEQIGRDITLDEGVTIVANSALGSNWSVEKIMALKSDLIIASSSMSGYKTIYKPAQAAGIPVISVTYEDFSDYLKWFKVFAYVGGQEELWEEVALKTLDKVIEIVMASNAQTKVLSLFSGPSSILANTNNSLMGNMLEELGATNIVKVNDTSERIEINLEYIIQEDPDLILVTCHASEEEARFFLESSLGSNPLWNSLRAVKEGKVIFLSKLLFHNKPNSQFAKSYQQLADLVKLK